MIERKCSNCGTWNNDEDYCKSCGTALSPKALDKQKTEQLKKEAAAIPPSKVDVFLEKAKTSKYLVVRIGYYIFYSIFLVLGAFGAFIAWLAAMANA